MKVRLGMKVSLSKRRGCDSVSGPNAVVSQILYARVPFDDAEHGATFGLVGYVGGVLAGSDVGVH